MNWRPFYRTVVFWAGVPGLLLLLIGWWDSGRHDCFIAHERGADRQELVTGMGRVTWVRVRDLVPAGHGASHPAVKPVTWGRMVGTDEKSGAERGRGFDFTKAYEGTSERVKIAAWGIDRQVDIVRVGMWVPVLGYVALWLGAVWWWQRRQARVRRSLTDVGMENEKEVEG